MSELQKRVTSQIYRGEARYDTRALQFTRDGGSIHMHAQPNLSKQIKTNQNKSNRNRTNKKKQTNQNESKQFETIQNK
jgi:hypothetical protein